MLLLNRFFTDLCSACVNKSLIENHVQIMTPAYRTDPAQPKVVPEDHWFARVAGKMGNGNEQSI